MQGRHSSSVASAVTVIEYLAGNFTGLDCAARSELSDRRPVKTGSLVRGGTVALLKNRKDAGRLLADKLAGMPHARPTADTVLLALPRGGVPVAFEMAQRLGLPLEPLVVRKLGVPHFPEFAMGAIAAGGHCMIDRELVRRLRLTEASVSAAVATATRELQEREQRYPASMPLTSLSGRPIIVVDDGMATGSTMLAAIRALRSFHVGAITVAVPVLSREAREKVAELVDAVVCLQQPEPFDAVGQWYADFRQVEVEEASALLRQAQRLQVPALSAAAAEHIPSH